MNKADVLRAIGTTEGLEFLFDKELQSNKTANEVCDWMDLHGGRAPSEYSKDLIEKKHGEWVKRQKQNIQHVFGKNFYNSNLEIVKRRGYPNLFNLDNKEIKSNEICYKACDWMDLHDGKRPSQFSKDLEERQLAGWISYNIRTKRGIGKGSFYNSNLEIVKMRGYPDLFDPNSREIKSNEMCYKVCDFIDKYGRKPAIRSKNLEEKRLAVWIKLNKRSKNKKGRCKFYQSNQKILDQRGYSDLLD